MPKLTDQQLGDLLRETFADHENEARTVATTTKRRPLVPVLLAAAAVVGILAGTGYVVQHTGHSPAPAASTPTVPVGKRIPADPNAAVWAEAIHEITSHQVPAGGWKKLTVLGMPDLAGGHLTTGEPTITPEQQRQIAGAVSDVAPVEWQTPRSIVRACRSGWEPHVMLGKITGNGDYREVRLLATANCGQGYSATYRLEKGNGGWVVTKTFAVGN